MKVLAVDHGTRHIGLAISDISGLVARPLKVHVHVSRKRDAFLVAQSAQEEGASLIVLGVPTNSSGYMGYAARRTRRFATALSLYTEIPLRYWDESHTSNRARQLMRPHSRSKRRSPSTIHATEAAIILQDYLDAHAPQTTEAPRS